MTKTVLILPLILVITAVVYAQNKGGQPVTVNHVDLKKYAGLWYEIARMPNRFQSDCSGNTTARYTLSDDGNIRVVNSCSEIDGGNDSVEGIAKIVDKKTNAKLKVSFFSILGIRPFWGDYWIIGLDDEYRYAVIGTPDRKYGWILSRTPQLGEAETKEAYKILVQNGYEPAKFIPTAQKSK